MYEDDSIGIGGVITVIVIIAGLIGGAIFLFGGSSTTPTAPKLTEEQTAREVQKNIVTNVPIPQITTSQERLNVAKRAELFNDENKISYVYLTSYGKVMAFYTVKGKVSSLQSYMSPTQKLVKGDGSPCSYYSESCQVVDAPDIDGTYGDNVAGIFFFTTDGAYVEWNGDYMMSDQPLKLTTQPELVRTIK